MFWRRSKDSAPKFFFGSKSPCHFLRREPASSPSGENSENGVGEGLSAQGPGPVRVGRRPTTPLRLSTETLSILSVVFLREGGQIRGLPQHAASASQDW